MDIGLFIKDFEMGTKISERLSQFEYDFGFCETISDVSNELKLIIIDLNDVEYGDINFIKGIVKKNNNIDLIGYMENIIKEHHDLLKKAGCRMILSKSSIFNNIKSLLPEM